MSNRNALLVKFSRTSRDTYGDQPDLVSNVVGGLFGTYHFTLRDQLARIELGDHTFQDLVYDRW